MTPVQREVAEAIAEISRRGPVKAHARGDMAVGKTLMDLLGMSQETATKPRFKGMVLTARRQAPNGAGNRVNLFAMVPDWKISACKSSEEIAAKYGYDRDGGRKLYVTVGSRGRNTRGLFLEVDHAAQLLRERHRESSSRTRDVAAWHLDDLKGRLLDRHPASAWIVANVSRKDGEEYFHYRYIQFTDTPRAEFLPKLIEQGTVTLDHLILTKDGRTVEKGPLFKIKPENVRALFPESPRYDLMAI